MIDSRQLQVKSQLSFFFLRQMEELSTSSDLQLSLVTVADDAAARSRSQMWNGSYLPDPACGLRGNVQRRNICYFKNDKLYSSETILDPGSVKSKANSNRPPNALFSKHDDGCKHQEGREVVEACRKGLKRCNQGRNKSSRQPQLESP